MWLSTLQMQYCQSALDLHELLILIDIRRQCLCLPSILIQMSTHRLVLELLFEKTRSISYVYTSGFAFLSLQSIC